MDRAPIEAKKNPRKRMARRVQMLRQATNRWHWRNSNIRASWLLQQQREQQPGRQRRRPQVRRRRGQQHQPVRQQVQQQRRPVQRRERQGRLQQRVQVRARALLPSCRRRPG